MKVTFWHNWNGSITKGVSSRIFTGIKISSVHYRVIENGNFKPFELLFFKKIEMEIRENTTDA
jgi:hypothetical protein